MGVLFMMLAALIVPSHAADRALAVPVQAADAVEAGEEVGPGDELEVRLSSEPDRSKVSNRWTRVGYSGYFAVWNQPGYSPTVLTGESLDLEVGFGRASVRPRVTTLRVGRAYLGLEGGIGAAVRLVDSDDQSGLFIGVDAGAGWTTEGARWSVGPEIGWASVLDVRLGVAMTSMSGEAQQWSNLRGSHRGVQVTLTLRPNAPL